MQGVAVAVFSAVALRLFEASLGELLLQFVFFSKLLTPRNRIECSDWSVSCFKSSQGGFYLSLANCT